jgi:hypothetical protein
MGNLAKLNYLAPFYVVSIYQLRKMTIQMHLTGLTPVALSIYDLL